MSDRPNILIIDDIPSSLKVLAEILKEDYELKVANSGERGLELALQEPQPDLILLDVEMPDINGYQVCSKLKQNLSTKDIPVMFITVHGNEDCELKGLKLGAVDYIAKPFQEAIVKQRVATHIQLREYQKELLSYQSYLEVKVQEEIEKREAQEFLLVQQAKMAAMGEMIGAIGHQMMQPLNSINLATTIIETEQDDISKDVEESCKTINDMVEYLTMTISDFKNFFKPMKLKSNFSVSETVTQSEKILKHQLLNNSIEVRLTGNDFTIYGKKNELIQVLINLISNAKDVLRENNSSDNRFIDIKLSKEFNVGKITIKDNGGGVPEEFIDKLFVPYQTTKGEKGTGIGLYMSKLIVEDSFNGEIAIKNDNDGAVFTINIPLLESDS